MFYRKVDGAIEVEEVNRRVAAQQRWLQLLLFALAISFMLLAATGKKPSDRRVLERITAAAPELQEPSRLTSFSHWLRSDVTHYEVLRPKEHAVIGGFYAAAGAAGLAFLLAFTIQWWMPRGHREDANPSVEHEADEENKGETGFARWVSGAPIIYVLITGAVLAGAWLRAPRLTHSLWNDEAYATKSFIHGQWERNEAGGVDFHPVTWTDTLHEQRNGNNHLLFSLVGRLSLSMWRSLTGAEPERFSESAVRMPSYVAGILTVLLIGVIGWETGMGWVGVGAAWLLALHPWHIRYAVEARGYSLSLLGMLLALLGLIRGIRSQRLAPWLLFAAGEAMYLLSFAGSVYVAVATNLLALALLLLRGQPRRVYSLLAMNLLGAIPVLLLMLPSVPQILGFLAHDNSPRLASGWQSITDVATHLVAGVLPVNPQPGLHDGTSWEVMRFHHLHQTSILGWGVLFTAGLGLLLAMFEGLAARLSIVGMAVAGLLGYWHGTSSGSPNLSWYYIYLLLPMVLAMALLAARAGSWAPLWMGLMVAFYGWATEESRFKMVHVDRQPMRQTVAFIRGKQPDSVVATYGVSDRQALLYDPGCHVITKPEHLQQAMLYADQQQQQMFVFLAGDAESGARWPELHAAVTRSRDFQKVAEFKGTEALFSYTVWQCSLLK